MGFHILPRRSLPRHVTAPSGGGSFVDNALFSFTSSASVSGWPTVEFTGGPDGEGASGSSGDTFSRSGWITLGAPNSLWKKSSVRALNRGLSLLYDATAQGEIDTLGGNGRGTYQYDTGAGGFTELYTSTDYYWDYPHLDALQCQWKVMRWQQQTDHTGGGGPEVVDGYRPSAYMSHHQDNNNVFLVNFVSDVVDGDADVAQYFSPPDNYSGGPVKMIRNAWFRVETFMKENTGGSANGTFRVVVTEIGNLSNTWSRTYTNVKWRGAADNSNVFRYLIFQNYEGNTNNVYGAWEQAKFYMQEHYISKSLAADAQRRIVLVNSTTPGSETYVGIPQKVTAASGTDRTIRCNIPSWVTGSKYLREYDATNGVVGHTGPY